jgi:galactokinase
VNLLGEHIDYSLYDVLPMAVCVDSLVAVPAIPSSNGHASIHIYNVHDEKFPGQEVVILAEGEITIDASKYLWTNYFMAGLSGFVDVAQKYPRLSPNQLASPR